MLKRLIILFLFALIPVALLSYAHLIEREWIDKTEHIVECKDWHGDELRLAVLTDLHARPDDGEYLDRVVKETLALHPHAVLLLGDYMNDHHPHESMQPEELGKHLRPLTALPCFAVLGNHDYYHGEANVRGMFSRLGIPCVEGQRVELAAAGGVVDIGGIRCRFTFDTPGKVPEPRPGVPLLLLSHTPVGAQHAHPQTLLTVSGHSHGGQVCWPTGAPVWMADGKTPADWAQGTVQVHGRNCYVCRGIGTSSLPIRFCCRPELLLLRIKPQAGSVQ